VADVRVCLAVPKNEWDEVRSGRLEESLAELAVC
jgi:hypothetical protein